MGRHHLGRHSTISAGSVSPVGKRIATAPPVGTRIATAPRVRKRIATGPRVGTRIATAPRVDTRIETTQRVGTRIATTLRGPVAGPMTSWLHEQRLEAVMAVLRTTGARTLLDLGCGDGDLFVRLVTEPGIRRMVGVDLCRASLDRLRGRLRALGDTARAEVDLVHGSITEGGAALAGFDCAILIETIEHIDPAHLSVLERAVFARMRPATVVMTTPNAEFNALLGVPPHRFRHPGHRFEWSRARFRNWVQGVAARGGYDAVCSDIAGAHPDLGGASQMAVFRLASGPARGPA